MDPEKILTRDISKTFGCPLASAVRSRLRKSGITKGFSAVFSTENAIRSAIIESFSRNKRSTVGTVSYMPAAFGCHCASAVIKKILDIK
jgi:tRNA A37 threonylcarbamoyladenosine dehydratase